MEHVLVSIRDESGPENTKAKSRQNIVISEMIPVCANSGSRFLNEDAWTPRNAACFGAKRQG